VPAQVLAAHRARDRRQRSIQALSASPGIVRITLGDTHAGAAPSAPLPTRRATSQTPIVDRREMLSRILLVSQPAPSRSAVVQPPVPTRRSSNIDINILHPPSHTRHLLLLMDSLIPSISQMMNSQPNFATESPMDIVLMNDLLRIFPI